MSEKNLGWNILAEGLDSLPRLSQVHAKPLSHFGNGKIQDEAFGSSNVERISESREQF
jgi:hypothetical protein